jgi:hypothetical protein
MELTAEDRRRRELVVVRARRRRQQRERESVLTRTALLRASAPRERA